MSALPWMQHLIVVPVLLPLLVGALLIPVAQNRHGFKFAASAVSGVRTSWDRADRIELRRRSDTASTWAEWATSTKCRRSTAVHASAATASSSGRTGSSVGFIRTTRAPRLRVAPIIGRKCRSGISPSANTSPRPASQAVRAITSSGGSRWVAVPGAGISRSPSPASSSTRARVCPRSRRPSPATS